MKLLFYGGCHAAALSRVFSRYALNVETCAHLTNFDLIRKGKPVPYDYIATFDKVIFSPIRNKADYNTVYLESFLQKRSIPFLKYPWLQWEGYFPGSKRSQKAWYVGWWPEALEKLALDARSFESFCDLACDGTALHDIIASNFEKTTSRLSENEHDCDIKISSYVLSSFDKSRLFLTNDHAGLELYKYIVKNIADWAGCKIDFGFYETTIQVQLGIQVPILPAVKAALGLSFPCGEFMNNLMLGGNTLSLAEYLSCIWAAKDISLATAKANTRIFVIAHGANEVFHVTRGSRYIVKDLHSSVNGIYNSYDLIGSRGAQSLPNYFSFPCQNVSLYRHHWDFSQ